MEGAANPQLGAESAPNVVAVKMASLTFWTGAISCEQTLQRAVRHHSRLSLTKTTPVPTQSHFPYLHIREFLGSDGHCWYLMGLCPPQQQAKLFFYEIQTL